MRRPRRSLTVVTPPATEPVTLTEAKAWARIDGTDDDAILTGLVTAARMAAEEYLRRTLITTVRKLTLDLADSPFGNCYSEGTYDLPVTALYGGLPATVELPKGPAQSITSVVTYDLSDAASTYSANYYRIDAAGDRLVLNYGSVWPSNLRPVAACAITYAAGYGTASAVPQPIKSGMLIHVASLYEQRGMCEDAMALPPGTTQLYNQYRIMGDRLG